MKIQKILLSLAILSVWIRESFSAQQQPIQSQSLANNSLLETPASRGNHLSFGEGMGRRSRIFGLERQRQRNNVVCSLIDRFQEVASKHISQTPPAPSA